MSSFSSVELAWPYSVQPPPPQAKKKATTVVSVVALRVCDPCRSLAYLLHLWRSPLLQECVSPTHTIRAARASMGRHFPNFQGEGSSPFRISKKNCRENKDEPATMQSQNTRTNHCVRATPSIAIISECDRRANEHPVKGPALVLRSDVQLNEVIGRIGWILLLQYWREVQLRENRYQRISSFFSLRLGRWMYVHLDARQTT